MANFEKAFHFRRFVPNIGNNKQLPQPDQLALELATGMTKVDVLAFNSGIRTSLKSVPPPFVAPEGMTPEAADEAKANAVLDHRAGVLAGIWGPYVRLEHGGHTIEGRPVGNLGEYLRALIGQNGSFAIMEISNEVARLNSVDGTLALFSDALSGGSAGTDDQSSAKDVSPTADR